MRYYHYLKAKHAIMNLKHGLIKVATFDDMNDPYELMSMELSKRDQRYMLNEIKEYMNSNYGILCLSEDRRNPVMWSHYADCHKGVCLRLVVNSVENLHKVKYLSKRIKIGTEFNNAITEGILRRLFRTKYIDWKYEKEWRLFSELGYCKKLEEDGRNKYFRELGDDIVIDEIYLGSRIDAKMKAEIIKAAIKHRNRIKVYQTRLAYKNFAIVKDIQLKSRTGKKPRQ